MIDTYPPMPELLGWSWNDFSPIADQLLRSELTEENAAIWLKRWSDLQEHVHEIGSRAEVAVTVNTVDAEAEKTYESYLELSEKLAAVNNELKKKLMSSGLNPEGFALALQNMKAESAIFSEANLPLQSEEAKLGNEYGKIVGARTVEWEGKTVTVSQLGAIAQSPDREKRELAWRMAMDRRQSDRETLNELWTKFMVNRLKQSENAGFKTDYRSLVWQRLHRWDYSVENCREFHEAIEKAVVPAASRIYEARRKELGLATLRPWDLDVETDNLPALTPFKTGDELTQKTQAVVDRVDPVLAGYLSTMTQEGLLDLDNRPNKSPGGYCTDFPVAKRPFIFMNAVGLHDDVQTMLHEAGHAFHVFESANLPTCFQREVGAEFAEVASMSFELLGGPHLAGTFYSEEDAARARNQHLEKLILFWPYMAVVDSFQHWVYENPALSNDSDNCDAEWERLWLRFMPGVDWNGLEEIRKTGWQRKLHIYQIPFYYIEYGLAQLGAVQVWRNSMTDAPKAIQQYRSALALGSTLGFPGLFAKAGAKFGFDRELVQECVNLIESNRSK